MGYNSLVMICNDALGAINKDPEGFAKKLYIYIGGGVGAEKPYDFGHGGHLNGFQIVWNSHADVTGVVGVGGNHASVIASIGVGGDNRHDLPEGQIKILQEVARKFGYHLVKNSSLKRMIGRKIVG